MQGRVRWLLGYSSRATRTCALDEAPRQRTRLVLDMWNTSVHPIRDTRRS